MGGWLDELYCMHGKVEENEAVRMRCWALWVGGLVERRSRCGLDEVLWIKGGWVGRGEAGGWNALL